MGTIDTRDQIIEAADRLFYQKGYEHTSFADIAAAVRISRGNFYHHFKSKDDILDAVIDARLDRTRRMLADWEAAGKSPQERICLFVEILIRNQARIMRYGCPVGTLCMELARLGHATRTRANEIMDLFRRWLIRQFREMGGVIAADDAALHLLGRSQGVATLASTFHDEQYVEREVRAMCEWVKSGVME